MCGNIWQDLSSQNSEIRDMQCTLCRMTCTDEAEISAREMMKPINGFFWSFFFFNCYNIVSNRATVLVPQHGFMHTSLHVTFKNSTEGVTHHRWRRYEVSPQRVEPCASEVFCACWRIFHTGRTWMSCPWYESFCALWDYSSCWTLSKQVAQIKKCLIRLKMCQLCIGLLEDKKTQ